MECRVCGPDGSSRTCNPSQSTLWICWLMAKDFEKPAQNQEDEAAAEAEQSADNTRTLQQDRSAMQMILRRTDRARRRPILLEGALWYLTSLGAVVLSVLLLGALWPGAIPHFTGWMLCIGAGAATLGVLAAWLGFRRSRGDLEAVARRLQRRHPAFRNDVVAALEFAETLLGA